MRQVFATKRDSKEAFRNLTGATPTEVRWRGVRSQEGEVREGGEGREGGGKRGLRFEVRGMRSEEQRGLRSEVRGGRSEE